MNYSIADGTFLIQFARKAIETYVKSGERIDIPKDISSKFRKPSGVFVSLYTLTAEGKSLRGCIGFPEPTLPLIQAVRESAISSAVSDPRFPPVTSDELDHIIIELSILTPPKPLKVGDPLEYLKHIEIGKHGLIVERGWSKGLLLPQVAVEYGWNVEEFLMHTCLKAGLSTDAWLLSGTKIYTFTCIVFAEKEPKGNIVKASLKWKER